jgi:hypothetical protein
VVLYSMRVYWSTTVQVQWRTTVEVVPGTMYTTVATYSSTEYKVLDTRSIILRAYNLIPKPIPVVVE